MAELLPCPFCGADGKINKHQGHTGTQADLYKFNIHCVCCHCEMNFFATEADVVEAWNKRVYLKNV
jgi:Lar family restriction alleviation protein